jgi:LysM repeat protein
MRKIEVWTIAAAMLIGGCAPRGPVVPAATASPGVTLTPYESPDPAPSRTPTPGRIATATPLPTPTATPFLYKIAAGDTLLGIAFRFGLALADLLAANPGIDPQFLTIGDDLIIPILDNPSAAAAVPTPVGYVIPAGDPVCHPAADGSLWCFQLYENQGQQAVEGLSARFTLYDLEGEPLDARTGLPPVNLLQPGAAVPLAARFPETGGAPGAVGVTVLSALPLPPGDPRYVEVSVSFDVELDGQAARVSGTASPPAGTTVAGYRIGLVALDADGQVIGVRVLDLDGPGPGAFEAVVYSLAGDIERVEVLVEGLAEE